MPYRRSEKLRRGFAECDRWQARGIRFILRRMKSPDYTPEPSFDSAAPSQDEISLRAHQLWCQQGCPQGHDVDNWLEAERQLLSEYANRTASIPSREDVGDLEIARGDSPFSNLSEEAPLTTRVENQVIQPGRPASRQSPTSLDL